MGKPIAATISRTGFQQKCGIIISRECELAFLLSVLLSRHPMDRNKPDILLKLLKNWLFAN
jgi:hypothetical protein